MGNKHSGRKSNYATAIADEVCRRVSLGETLSQVCRDKTMPPKSTVLEWVKGTGLRPILNGLGDQERERFLVEYAQRLRAAYPIRAKGQTLYPFRRLFIVATR